MTSGARTSTGNVRTTPSLVESLIEYVPAFAGVTVK